MILSYVRSCNRVFCSWKVSWGKDENFVWLKWWEDKNPEPFCITKVIGRNRTERRMVFDLIGKKWVRYRMEGDESMAVWRRPVVG